MSSLEWALMQHDWCPYRKRRFGHTQRKMRWRPREKTAADKPSREPAQILCSQLSEETSAVDTSILDFQLPDL